MVMIFFYIFIGKIGRNEAKFLLVYVVNLVLLHVTLAVSLLAHHKLAEMNITCKFVAYMSYFFIVACFSWLCMMCLHIRQNVRTYRKLLKNVDFNFESDEKFEIKRFYIKLFSTFGISILATIAVIVADFFVKRENVYYCMRLQFDSMNYAFGPVLVVMTCGTVFNIQTFLLIRKASRCTKDKNMRSSNQMDPEIKK